MVDTIELAQALIRRPSVTPADEGALDVLQNALEALGFDCHRLPFGEGTEGPDARVDNLYARLGTRAPNFCFAGHTDVVPTGDVEAWSADPFAGEIRDGVLFGRGASDMKGAIAAFVSAVADHLDGIGGAEALPGSISLLITGDEEGEAINGTRKVLGTREVMRDELDERLALVEEWLAEKPKARSATLYGPGMRRRIVGKDTRRWLENMEIIQPALVREFPKGADPRIVEAEQADGYALYDQDGCLRSASRPSAKSGLQLARSRI